MASDEKSKAIVYKQMIGSLFAIHETLFTENNCIYSFCDSQKYCLHGTFLSSTYTFPIICSLYVCH